MIEFRNVSMTYKTGIYALKNVSFKVMDGEFVFVIGRSGSGKSTLIKLLTCEENPVSGNVFVDNYEISFLKRSLIPYLRRNIGMVFQDFRLIYSKTVYENVAFAMEIIGASRKLISTRVPIVLSIVGLRDKAQMKPNQLSGGEQQRVAIARAMVNNPMLILADEPTGNLDPENSESIMALLEDINCGGTTIMVCTHDSSIVNKMRRRVIEIADGFLVRDELLGEYNLAIGCDFKKNKQKIRSEVSVNNKAKKKANAKSLNPEPFVRNINIKFSEEEYTDTADTVTEDNVDDIAENSTEGIIENTEEGIIEYPVEKAQDVIAEDVTEDIAEDIAENITEGIIENAAEKSQDVNTEDAIDDMENITQNVSLVVDPGSAAESDTDMKSIVGTDYEIELLKEIENEIESGNENGLETTDDRNDEIEMFPIRSNKNSVGYSEDVISLSGSESIDNIKEILSSIRNSKEPNSTLYSIEIEDTQEIISEDMPDFTNLIKPKRIPAPGNKEDVR